MRQRPLYRLVLVERRTTAGKIARIAAFIAAAAAVGWLASHMCGCASVPRVVRADVPVAVRPEPPDWILQDAENFCASPCFMPPGEKDAAACLTKDGAARLVRTVEALRRRADACREYVRPR